jgi:hypothetical protein
MSLEACLSSGWWLVLRGRGRSVVSSEEHFDWREGMWGETDKDVSDKGRVDGIFCGPHGSQEP